MKRARYLILEVMEIGYITRWWARCNHFVRGFGLWELVNLLWLRNINKEGIAMLGIVVLVQSLIDHT